MDKYRELCDESDRRGLRVTLSTVERKRGTKLERLSILDLHSNEVASVRVERIGLERGAGALLELLSKRPTR